MKITHLTEALMARTSDIAYEGKVTLYDALPVAIADQRKIVCITADAETRHKKLCPMGYPVELL